MNQRRTLAALAGFVALTVGAGAITASAAPAGTATAARVKVSLGTKSKEFALTLSVRSAPRGKVTFVVHNGGKMPHEFVVLKTTTLAGKLRMSGGRASEKGAVGEIGEFKPGLTKTLTLTLKPGHYALICNVPGHYLGGQYADFTVK